MFVSNEHHLMGNRVHAMDLKTKVLDYRQQEKVRNNWLHQRLDTVLPRVMKRCGIDLWVICCKEYNEDPVLTTLVPCAMMTARRTTMLVHHLQDNDTVCHMAHHPPRRGPGRLLRSHVDQPQGPELGNSKALLPRRRRGGKRRHPPKPSGNA